MQLSRFIGTLNIAHPLEKRQLDSCLFFDLN